MHWRGKRGEVGGKATIKTTLDWPGVQGNYRGPAGGH